MVRAGDSTAEVDAMRAAGRVGVRYETVGNATEWTKRQVEDGIAELHPDGVDALRSRLMRFVSDMRPGDLVVTPNAAGHELWLSEVTGAYEYAEEPLVPAYHHTRTVHWLGWVDRDTPWLLHKLSYVDSPGAVVELKDAPWWFDQLSTHELPAERQKRLRAPALAKPARAPRAKKADAPVKPPRGVEPPRFLCNGPCGFQWLPAVMVDGFCPDCRGE